MFSTGQEKFHPTRQLQDRHVTSQSRVMTSDEVLSILRGKEGCDWPALSVLRASHKKSGTSFVKVFSLLEFIQSWGNLRGKQVGNRIHHSHTWPEEAKGRELYWVDCPWVESSDRFRHLTKRASSCGRMFLNFTSHSPKIFFQGWTWSTRINALSYPCYEKASKEMYDFN